MNKTKSFDISKHLVFSAFKKVKANRGSAGVDGQEVKDFENRLKDNLYKIWNRMSSGTYFPKPVLRVEIPKADGRMRPLGIPTITDRIAQMTAKMALEPSLETVFHTDSYGYRPGKSAEQAIRITRQRCWRFDWVIDLDIKGFFDNLDHDLLMKAVVRHTQERWIILYIERWLKAPVQFQDDTQIYPLKGTPQGGVISPLLANLFLHYAFDMWMDREFPSNPFARYADDVVVHCRTQAEAEHLKEKITARMRECNLELHPDKTKIVYCKDDNRKGNYHHTEFDFLGFTFRSRTAKNRCGVLFNGFNPAVSMKSRKAFSNRLKSFRLQRRSDLNIFEISRLINPLLRGWLNYFGCVNESETYFIMKQFNSILYRWGRRKYKRLRGRKAFFRWIKRLMGRYPDLFIHWRIKWLGVMTIQ